MDQFRSVVTHHKIVCAAALSFMAYTALVLNGLVCLADIHYKQAAIDPIKQRFRRERPGNLEITVSRTMMERWREDPSGS
jgi:hypothetical protein